MQSAAIAPSHPATVISPAPAAPRRPPLAMILIGVSVLATLAWVVGMVWLASALLGVF
jgi:hypothetical protein